MKKIGLLATAISLACLTSMSAYAGAWAKNTQGWWYDNGNSTWPASTWQWIDGNNDGVAECYYFNPSGYCLTNTTTPDGYMVNADGAWTVNGIIQTKAVGASTTGSTATASIADGYYRVSFNQSDIKQIAGQYTMTVTTYGEKVRSYENGYGDWNTSGQLTLPVSSSAIFVDEANVLEEGTKRYSFAELASNSALYAYGFDPDNAQITVKNGVVVEIDRNYMA